MNEAVERCVEDFLGTVKDIKHINSFEFVESFVRYLKEIVKEKDIIKEFSGLLQEEIGMTLDLFDDYDNFLLHEKRDVVKGILCEAMLEISPNLVLPKLNRFVHPARWQKCRSGVCVEGLFAANNTGPHPAGCGRRLFKMGLRL